MRRALICTAAVLVVLGIHAYGQVRPTERNNPQPIQRNLAPVDRTPTSHDAGAFWLPTKCDADGNIYLRPAPERDAPILKIGRDGRSISVSSASVPNLATTGIGYFAVDQSGTIHQLADFSGERDRFIVHFRPDGTYISRTRLELGTAVSWRTSQIAVFTAGTFLVAGQIEADATQNGRPFTGIFSSDGTLLKEVRLPDDDNLGGEGKAGAGAAGPDMSRAVASGSAESAPDGNVYLMRRTSPVIVYAISPGGEVIRRFTVIPPGDGFFPIAPLHISGARMAILFDDDRGKHTVKVVSLGGDELAAYGTPMDKDRTGPILACYTSDHERFTFLGTDDGKLILKSFEPQ